MAKHTIFTFQLHRRGVVLIVIGCIFVAALLATAGYFAGFAHAKKEATPTPPAPAPLTSRTQAAAPAAPPVPPAAPSEEFSLRLGQTIGEDEAKALQAQLRTKEIETIVVTIPTEGGGAIYSLESGRYPSRAAAAAAASQLENRASVSAVVVPAPPLPKTPGSP
jgi:cell division septation protein DedD